MQRDRDEKTPGEVVRDYVEFWERIERRCQWAAEDISNHPLAHVPPEMRAHYAQGRGIAAEGASQARAAAAVLEAPTPESRAALVAFDTMPSQSQLQDSSSEDLAMAVLYRLGRYRDEEAKDFLAAEQRMDKELRAVLKEARDLERAAQSAKPEVAPSSERRVMADLLKNGVRITPGREEMMRMFREGLPTFEWRTGPVINNILSEREQVELGLQPTAEELHQLVDGGPANEELDRTMSFIMSRQKEMAAAEMEKGIEDFVEAMVKAGPAEPVRTGERSAAKMRGEAKAGKDDTGADHDGGNER